MRIRRTIVVGFSGAALVLAGACVALNIQARRNQRAIPGVYLADGGLTCLVISRNMEVEKNYLFANTEFRVLAAKIGSGCRLYGTYTSPGSYKYVENLAYSFAPSRARPGDWDLVGFGPTNWGLSQRGPATWFRSAQQLLARGHVLSEPLTRAVPYLYRVDDPNVAEYFRLQYDAEDPKAAFEKAQVVLETHPGDPHIRVLYLGAAARNNDTSEVARRWDEWKPRVEDAEDPCLAYANREMQRWLRSRRLSAAGRNAYVLLEAIRNAEIAAPKGPDAFSSLLACEGYVPDWLPGFEPGTRPKLIGLAERAKILLALGTLRMFEGKRQEAVTILAAIHRLGQLMSERDSLLEMLLGLIFRNTALEGLRVYALDVPEREPDFRELWQVLERLEKGERALVPSKIRTVEMSFEAYLPHNSAIIERRMQDRSIAQTGFDLLRMATAARYRLITRGEFPRTNEDFAPLLPQGPPKDPFGDGPLRFRLTTDSLVCYSIGPEVEDQKAAESDGTTGARARKEISIRIPREREYPFPRDGLRATRVEDVTRRFPNGLPMDPWRNRIGTTATTTGDVLVYSGGPSGQAFQGGLTSTSQAMTLQYDPTNGITSPGELFIRVPRR